MSLSTYRNRRQVISDSDDSEDGVGSVQGTPSNPILQKRCPSPDSPCSPGPSCPRVSFARGPLTPRRTVAFAPTPVKSVNFNLSKGKGSLPTKSTPKRMAGVRLFKSAPREEAVNVGLERDMDCLDLGALSICDSPQVQNPPVEDVNIADSPEQGQQAVVNVDGGEKSDDELADVDGVLSFSPAPSSNRSPSLPGFTEDCSLPTIDTSHCSLSPCQNGRRNDVDLPNDNDTDSDNDSELAWLPTPRRQGKSTRRKLVLSDSEDEEPVIAGPSRRKVVDITALSDSDTDHKRDEHDEAAEGDSDSPDPDSEGEGDSLGEEDDRGANEYDDSYGSMADFIVDDEDDYMHSEDDGSREEGDRPRKERKAEKKKKQRECSANISEEEESDGILHYSPVKKPLTLPNFDGLIIASDSDSDSDSRPVLQPKSQSRVKKALETPRKKGEWVKERVMIANSIFEDLDRRVFESKLGAAGTGARIEWNKRLLTTAGVARSKKIRKSDGSYVKDYWIELSEKVLTGREQIINTVAHEMCHLASWIISDEWKNPHGRVFKSWGRKVMRARKDVEVTTTHAYVIEYKYRWKCTNERCGKIYQRHSKSIDPSKHACGSCRSKLEPMFDSKPKAASPFQVYLKANMAFAKAAMPGSSHGDVMRALSRRWGEVDPSMTTSSAAEDHLRYWKSMATAVTS